MFMMRIVPLSLCSPCINLNICKLTMPMCNRRFVEQESHVNMSKADILIIFLKSATSLDFSISVNGISIHPVACLLQNTKSHFFTSLCLTIFYHQVQEELLPKNKLTVSTSLHLYHHHSLILDITISGTDYYNSLLTNQCPHFLTLPTMAPCLSTYMLFSRINFTNVNETTIAYQLFKWFNMVYSRPFMILDYLYLTISSYHSVLPTLPFSHLSNVSNFPASVKLAILFLLVKTLTLHPAFLTHIYSPELSSNISSVLENPS